MAYTTIDDPTIYFNTKLWTGNGSTGTGQTGVGFQPDWIWIKARAGTQGTQSNNLFDSVRGEGKYLFSDSNDAESTDTNRLTSFDSDGFTVGSNNAVNASSTTYVAWNWKAGGSASSNSDGSITSSVSANTTAGFSIVSYTGTGSNANVGHGLTSAPELIITKSRSATGDWKVHTSAIDGSWDVGTLNSTAAFGNSSYTASTSSIFYVGSGAPTNASSVTYVSYLLHSVKGYSKFGSYTGNGNADGTFIYTGFKPAWVLVKKISGGQARNWCILDNKREGFNPENDQLHPNTSGAESMGSGSTGDLLSNGFKFRATDDDKNESNPYIYMAFAESPFVNSNGVPNNAR